MMYRLVKKTKRGMMIGVELYDKETAMKKAKFLKCLIMSEEKLFKNN